MGVRGRDRAARRAHPTGWSLADLAPVGVLAAIALPAALGVAKPAVEPLRDPAHSGALDDADGVRDGRDGFLDLLRAASIVRVMIWHALGYWWISWTFAAMPAVFYVSGAVLAASMQHVVLACRRGGCAG